MSNTTTTNTTTTNIDSPSNFTVALDADNKIIWSSELTWFSAADLVSNEKRDAHTIIIGDNVTYLSHAFGGTTNVKNIFVYSDEMRNSVYTAFQNVNKVDENTGLIINSAGEVVTVSVLDNKNYLFDLYKENRDETKPIHVSDFGIRDYHNGYDTGSINLAILFVTAYGGKLIFEKEATYDITGPIRICPLVKNQNNTDIRNFEVNFNDCKITISSYKPAHRFDAADEKKNTMIYVNTGFAEDARIGIIQNVELDTGTQNRIHTGIYIDSSPQISCKNIAIKNVKRGIYIDSKSYEVFMDNITITKSINVNGGMVFADYPIVQEGTTFDAKTYYPDCKYVGLDCHASDSHFSNITVEDYLVGVRLLGGDNRIKNAVVKNEHSQNQRRYSVGYINGSGNYYINCKINDKECNEKEFYIGWMSEYAVPFFLNGCQWHGEDINAESYAFFIKPDHYSGGGIYASECSMTGPTVTGASPFKFSNVENYDIKYSGTTDNVKTKDE